jgi:hypothetical protein
VLASRRSRHDGGGEQALGRRGKHGGEQAWQDRSRNGGACDKAIASSGNEASSTRRSVNYGMGCEQMRGNDGTRPCHAHNDLSLATSPAARTT